MSDCGDNTGRHLLDAIDRAAEQLGAVAEQAERASLSTVLAAAVAHEISNILTPVRGYAEAALEQPADSELAAKALRFAAEGADRAIRAAEAVMESVGGRRAEEECADVRSAALRAVQLMGDGAEFVTVLGEGGAAAIGQISIEQVLLNLLINARAASLGSEFQVTVRLGCSTWNTIRIDVEDHGRGIPAARLAGIFDSGPRRGRGLGLLICRHLVEAAGGSIRVQSQPGKGTCFTMELPTAAARPVKAA